MIVFEGVINVLGNFTLIIHPHACAILLSKYTTMVMTALRLLNLWNNGCRIEPKPTARTFVLLCVLELEGASYYCSMQYEIVMHPE